MGALSLVEPEAAVDRRRWYSHHSRVGELQTAVKHYDRDGRLYSTAGLRWAAGCLRNGCELLIARPHLARDNLTKTPQILAHVALADGPLRRSALFPVDRLTQERLDLRLALADDLLARLKARHGLAGAPRSGREMEARLGWQGFYDLLAPMLRLAGAFEAPRLPLHQARDVQTVTAALGRCGALPRGGHPHRGRADDLAELLAASFAVAERQTHGMATLTHLMHNLERAYSLLTALMLLPENTCDAGFQEAKHHWIMTGELAGAAENTG